MTQLSDKPAVQSCAECGKIFSKEDMFPYESLWICFYCKPGFVQKIKEGVEVAPKASRMIGWKIFFFIILSLQLFSCVLSIQNILKNEFDFDTISDLIIGPFLLIALYGFSFRKRIGRRIAWKIFFPMVVIVDIIGFIHMYTHTKSPIIGPIFTTIIILMFSPLVIFEYIALYRYAFKKGIPWV